MILFMFKVTNKANMGIIYCKLLPERMQEHAAGSDKPDIVSKTNDMSLVKN
jgi:hypothetical protein